jgi:hypothetical protein
MQAAKARQIADSQQFERQKELIRFKLGLQAENGNGASYGKTGSIFQGADGRNYIARYASDGTTKIELATGPDGQELVPSRGVATVDTGTGTQVINKSTGAAVREIGKDIAGAESEKVTGRELAEGRLALPKISRGLEMYERKSAEVNKNIDDAIKMAGQFGTTGFVGGMSKGVYGSPAFALARKLDPVIANIGFDELQSMRDNSPTGGALGQVAVQELNMLQSVLGSLNQAQDSAEVIRSLERIKAIRNDFAVMKRRAYEEDVARFGASAVPDPASGESRNPTPTGSVMVYDPATGELKPK